MTKLRAIHGALLCGAIALGIGAAAEAEVSNYTIDPGSHQGPTDNSCVGPLLGIVGVDCTYNQSYTNDPTWTGPVGSANYYETGDSPYAKNPGALPLPEPTRPDPDSAELAIAGTLHIDDANDPCNGQNTIWGSFELAAGTRAYSAGQGAAAEETWGDGTIVYVLPETTPDQQNTLGDGSCEYIIGSQGFPALISTTSAESYPVNLDILNAGGDPVGPQWTGPEPGGIGVASWEGNPPDYIGNIGVAVSLDPDAFANGTYQCVDNTGDFNSPIVTTPDGCLDAAVDDTACKSDANNFCGLRRDQENWLARIVVAPNGDISEALIYATNESVVLENVPPASPNGGKNNSWDGTTLTFTASCDNCGLAKSDDYVFVTGTNAMVSLDIGANDDPDGVLDSNATTATVDAPVPQHGTCDIQPAAPGDVHNITCEYTSGDNFVNPVTDTFKYTLADGIQGPDAGLTATVTIEVVADSAPVAGDITVELDTQGVDPSSLRYTFNATTVDDNEPGVNPSVSTDNAATQGTAASDELEITYTPNADFFQGSDSFGYTIDDDKLGSPGVTPESDSGTVTVNIPNVAPTASDIEATVEQGASVPFTGEVTLGNGSIAQHTTDGSCDEGEVTISSIAANGAVVEVSGTYTAPDDFDGEDVCTYSITDENGAGDTAEGEVVIEVISSAETKYPGSGSALGPLTLLLLGMLPLTGIRRTLRIQRTQRTQ